MIDVSVHAVDGLPRVRKVAKGADVAALAHELAMARRAAQPGVVVVAHTSGGHGAVGDDLEDDVLVVEYEHAGATTLGTTPPTDVGSALAVVAGVAEVVAQLHRAGIVHGAIEPDHVVLDASGQPVLCGWGAAGMAGTSPAGRRGADAPTPRRPSDDVAALGELLQRMLDGCRGRGRDRDPRAVGARALAEHARHADPTARPGAQAVALRLRRLLAPPEPTTIPRRRSRRHVARPTTDGSTTDPTSPEARSIDSPSGARPWRGRPVHPGPTRRVVVVAGTLAIAGFVSIGGMVRIVVAGGDDSTVRGPDVGPGGGDREGGAGPDGEATRGGSASVTGPSDDQAPVPAVDVGLGLEPGSPGTASEPSVCPGALLPTTPPFPAPPCTASAPVPADGIDVGGQRFRVGAEGDEVLLLDGSCPALPVAVLVRPATGDVVAFPAWPASAVPLVGLPWARVAPGSHLETGPGPCGPIAVRSSDGSTTTLDPAALRSAAPDPTSPSVP